MALKFDTIEVLPENEFGRELGEVPLDLNLARCGDEGGQYVSRIYVWEEGPGLRDFLIEGPAGNKNVHLTGQYYFRYDPPRTSSTGSGQEPMADYHLYRGGDEIAAWNDRGQARQHSERNEAPQKTFDTLMQKYPGCCGITGRILEHLESWTLQRMLLVEGTENPCTLILPDN